MIIYRDTIPSWWRKQSMSIIYHIKSQVLASGANVLTLSTKGSRPTWRAVRTRNWFMYGTPKAPTCTWIRYNPFAED